MANPTDVSKLTNEVGNPVADNNVTLTAGPSRSQAWSLSVRNACTGKVVRTVTGQTSDKIVVRWDGRRNDGSLAPASTYRLVLRTGTRLPATGPSYAPLHQVLSSTGKASGCKRRA